jgi:hypothetical protein
MLKTRRPTSMRILSLIILGLILWNGYRLIQAIYYWPILNEYHAQPGSLYMAISGGFWFILGLLIVWGLWWKKTWAWYTTTLSIIGYSVWYWLDRLILQRPHSNVPFALILTFVFTVTCYILIMNQKSVRFFFDGSKYPYRFFRRSTTPPIK